MSSRPFEPMREGRFVFVSHAHADQNTGFGFLTPSARDGYQRCHLNGLGVWCASTTVWW